MFQDRPGIDVAHQFADVLQLPSARAMGANAFALAQGGDQRFGQAERGPVRLRQVQQLGAQRLQGQRIALELAFAGGQILRFELVCVVHSRSFS